MLQSKIQDVFNEPACGKNQGKSEKERKKGCTKQLVPGAAAGGCAFDGAKIALQPITDVAHLVHGPIACEGNSWDNRSAKSSGSRLYRTGFTTDVSELDVIYGGEKRLYKAIREVIEKYDPPAVFVYQTCVTALIGTQEPEYTTPYDINIIGEYNLSGELWQVKPLFDKLGIRILSCISGDAKYKEVAWSHRARATMMVCSKAMINITRKLEERYDIPYFEGSFYGISDMSDSLRQTSKLLVERGAPAELLDRTEALIREEEAKAWQQLEPYKARLAGKKVLLITGGVKSWSVVSALQEVGMEIVGTSVKKSTVEDKERIKELMGQDAHMLDDMSPREAMEALYMLKSKLQETENK